MTKARVCTMYNLYCRLCTVALHNPQAIALTQSTGPKTRSISFRELLGRVDAYARKLALLGLGLGTRAMIAINPSIEFYIALLALLKVGGVAVFIDPTFGIQRVKRYLARSHTAYLIASSRNKIYASPLGLLSGCKVISGPSGSLKSVANDIDFAAVAEDHPALITFTSGTSGESKCLVRTHGFLHRQSRAINQSLDRNAIDREFSTLPVFALNNLDNGNSTVIGTATMSAAHAIRLISSTKSQSLLMAPAQLESIIEHLSQTGSVLPFVSRVCVGGGPVYPHLPQSAARVFPNAIFEIVYGSSEAEPISHLRLVNAQDRELYQKKALEGNGLDVGTICNTLPMEVVIARPEKLCSLMDERQFVSATHGVTVGEILVRGNHVLASEKMIKVAGRDPEPDHLQGFHRTGDAGMIDVQGHLHYLGRIDRPSSTKEVYAGQIEAICVASTPGARKAACIPQANKVVLELDPRTSSKTIASSGIFGGHAYNILTTGKLPCDARHRSKIIYERL